MPGAPVQIISSHRDPRGPLPRQGVNVPRLTTPEEAECLDVLLDWAPDEAVRKAILVDNPAVLYGFD